MSFLAPQAYTKETLAKAFDWLQHQPHHVAQAATTPDNLVAIFLKAQRTGQLNLETEAPVSSKRFIDDLKSLKKEFAPFEDSPSAPIVEAHQEPPRVQRMENTSHPAPPSSMAAAPPVYVRETASFTRETAKPAQLQLDARSMESVIEIQNRFNLSSPQEALRMLITVGHKHIGHWP